MEEGALAHGSRGADRSGGGLGGTANRYSGSPLGGFTCSWQRADSDIDLVLLWRPRPLPQGRRLDGNVRSMRAPPARTGVWCNRCGCSTCTGPRWSSGSQVPLGLRCRRSRHGRGHRGRRKGASGSGRRLTVAGGMHRPGEASRALMRRMNHKTAVLIGGLFMAPSVAANTTGGPQDRAVFSFIRPGPQTSPFEYVLLGLVLGRLPAGAFIASASAVGHGRDRWDDTHPPIRPSRASALAPR